MPNILYIITSADLGGAQKYVLQLAKHFHGHIASGTEHNALFEQAKNQDIPVHKLRYMQRGIQPLYDVLAIWEVYRLVRKLKPDIIHTNSGKAGLLGAIAGRLAGSKVVFTAHGFTYTEPRSETFKTILINIERVRGWLCHHTIAVSETDRISAVQHGIVHPSKITAIHNGCEPISFISKSDSRNKLGISANTFAIGTIANHYWTKGIDILIEAATIIHAHKYPIKFYIIGHGPETKKLQSSIHAKGLTDTVILLGQIPEAKRLLQTFDVYVLPSRKEGFPYAILEAMQAGLPIIASQVGGVPEALGDAGVLITPNDPKTLAEALLELYYDENKRVAISTQAQKRLLQFTEDQLFTQTAHIYGKVGT